MHGHGVPTAALRGEADSVRLLAFHSFNTLIKKKGIPTAAPVDFQSRDLNIVLVSVFFSSSAHLHIDASDDCSTDQ